MHMYVYYTSNPSASQRSVRTSIICGSGTFCGNRGGCIIVPRVAPADLALMAAAPPLHRGSKSTSITSSTSIGMADADGSVNVDDSPIVVVVVEPHDNNHDEPTPSAALTLVVVVLLLLLLFASETLFFPHHFIRASCHFRNPGIT